MREQSTATDTRMTRFLLACGIAAAPVYLVLGLGQVLARDGFDVRRHAISHLSNGELGWIQIVNFLLSGALVVAGAVGVRGLRRHPRQPDCRRAERRIHRRNSCPVIELVARG